MKLTKKDLYKLLQTIDHKVDLLLMGSNKIDFSKEDASVKAETETVRIAKGQVPPSGPVNK